MIYDTITSYIDNYNQSINQQNKQTYGEVFTPFSLVHTMLDTIPIDIWKNPRLQWLDPANGTGHFMMIVFSRLWRELRDWEPDDLKRETHIITKMLFMVEINETNVTFSRQVFGKKANIYHQSFFTYDQSFDVVVGNPPFNISREKTCGKTQWQMFVKRILFQTLRSNGLFLFMTPPIWRKPCPEKSINTPLFSLLTKQNQMLYLSIQNKKRGMRDLGCNTRYDWYLVEKKNCYKHTIICDEDNSRCELYLPFYTWLPNSRIKVIMNLVAKRDETRLPILYDRTAYKADQKTMPLDKQWVSEKESSAFPFPLIHSTPQKGIQYRFSSVYNHGHFGIPKVIFGEGGAHHCVLDIDGKYGMTHGAMGIVVNDIEEGKQFQNIILSDRFKKLMDACCFSSYRMDWNVLAQFSKERFLYDV